MILHDYLLKNSQLRLIGCCNELNAGYAADGYARTSSTKVSVVIVPYMVGGLSILNAICGACSDRLKVIVISGCPNSDSVASSTLLHHTHAPGGKNQALNAFKGVTVAALRLSPSERPSEALDNALAQCLESSLPVYIEIPNDLVGISCLSPRPLSELIISPSLQDRGTVGAVVELLASACRPILVIGGLMQSCAAHPLVEALVEKLGCPVLCQPDARLISSFHPQYYGIFWPGIVDNNTEIIQDADLVLALGAHWGDLHTFGKFSIDSERHRLIDVQYDSVHLPNGRSLKHSGLRDIIANLMLSDVATKTYATRQAPEYPGQRSESSMKYPRGSRLAMNGVLENIQGLVNEKSTIVADCGQTWFAAIRLSLPSMATCHMQLLYASLGWSLPATLGCQLARPEGRTILLVGDGAFQMTAQELSTMVRMRLNPIILVFNNLGYKTEVSSASVNGACETWN
jgi:pyruvate decarboxylase